MAIVSSRLVVWSRGLLGAPAHYPVECRGASMNTNMDQDDDAHRFPEPVGRVRWPEIL
jgi:hypothetical protein